MRLQRVALQVEGVGKATVLLGKLWGSPQPAPLESPKGQSTVLIE